MFQPSTLVLVLLFLGPVARAQPAPERTHRQLALTLTGNPAAPIPEVRGARGIGIAFHFDGPIVEQSVEVDESRLRVVDVGPKSLLVELVAEPRAEQPSEVAVTFADEAKQRAVFRIIPHPSEVNTWVKVTRRTEQTGAECQARLDELLARCSAPSPTAFLRAGLLPPEGILARQFDREESSAGGLVSAGGVSFRGRGWVLVDLEIRNLTGQPWTPRVATFKSQDGTPYTVRLVTAATAEIPPGGKGRVWVETDGPPGDVGGLFTLEVSGADGRTLRVGNVKLAPRALEGKR